MHVLSIQEHNLDFVWLFLLEFYREKKTNQAFDNLFLCTLLAIYGTTHPTLRGIDFCNLLSLTDKKHNSHLVKKVIESFLKKFTNSTLKGKSSPELT